MPSLRPLAASGALVIVAFAGSLRLFAAIWHRDALAEIENQPGGWIGAVGIVIASAIVHELLHAIGWNVIARVPWRSISIRPTWRVMGFAAHTDVPVSARTFRVVAALPALILGGLPIAIGIAIGAGLFVLWGLFFLLECFSDFAAIFARAPLPKESGGAVAPG